MKAIPACAATVALSASAANLPWDWTGILGTGQSLSVGARALPVVSTNQPFHNLKLSTDHLPWPVDANDTNLALVPLVEPIGRIAPNYPVPGPKTSTAKHRTPPWPINSPRSSKRISIAISSASTAPLAKTARHDLFAKNPVQKGLNGRSYEAAMIETKAIARLAKAAGKTFGIGAIIVTHGESDAGNNNYEKELHQLWEDYNTISPPSPAKKKKSK